MIRIHSLFPGSRKAPTGQFFLNAVAWCIALSAAIALTGCDGGSGDDFQPAPSVTASDIAADPITGVDSLGRPVGANEYTFFSLRQNAVVPRADSATTNWDIALKATTILVNGGTSGPGNGGAQVLTTTFEDVTEAPETGYDVDSASGFAIPTGSGNGWYNYNPATMVVSPIPGRIIIVRCADGSFAKIRIVSYYRGAPASPNNTSESRYYTIEFAHQSDGSRQFE